MTPRRPDAAKSGRITAARKLIGWPEPAMRLSYGTERRPTRTTMSELCAFVLTRDVWTHRLDLARAVGSAPAISSALDGQIVVDIVTDWASRHGQPYSLTLTGDAGGTFRSGRAGQQLRLDALDFARLMAGRRPDGDIPDSPPWATKLLF